MKAVASKKRRVGIAGGGQLALLLAEAARVLGLDAVVLAASDDDPAVGCRGAEVVYGSASDAGELAGFLAQVDLVTFEQEMQSPAVLTAAVEQARGRGFAPRLLPSAQSFTACSDKLVQKTRLKAAGLPTAAWTVWAGAEVSAWLAGLSGAAAEFAEGAVLKWAHGGYDGRGTYPVKPPQWSTPEAAAFTAAGQERGVQVFAEAFVPFACELAVISVRAIDGNIVQYPAVITVQKDGVCAEVRGPAVAFGIAASVAAEAERLAKQVGTLFDLIGTYAVEFFMRSNGTLLINEIAPRVHNSGHFTLDAATVSQFSNHWHAVLGQPLGETTTAAFFGMVNILGSGDADLDQTKQPAPTGDGVSTWWYGKKESRLGRKLGHVNIVAGSQEAVEQRIEQVQKQLETWQQHLRSTDEVERESRS